MEEWDVLIHARDSWEELVEKLPHYCADEFWELRMVSFYDIESVTEYCNLGRDVWGCHLPRRDGFAGLNHTSTIVYLYNNSWVKTLTHEYAHFGRMCQGEGDSDHSHPYVWGEWLDETVDSYAAPY